MAYREEWEGAIALAWKTFLKFESKDYSAEGIHSFKQFISDSSLYRMFTLGEYQLFCAVANGKLIGIISIRSRSHISLLFVDESYHKRGIGRDLIQYVSNYLLTEVGEDKVTVNAAPYAVGFYHKVGFRDTGTETEKEGIRYTPMEFYL